MPSIDPFTPGWQPSPAPRRERGYLLGTCIGAAFGGNVLNLIVAVMAAGYFAGMDAADPALDPARAASIRSAQHAFHVAALLIVMRLAALTGVWMWKKWGVYLYATISAAALLLAYRTAPTTTIANLVVGVIVVGIIVPRWHMFE